MTARIRVQDGGVLRTLTRIRAYHAGSLRTINVIRAKDSAGTLRMVWNNLSVSLTGNPPADASGGGSSALIEVDSGSVTAVPAGGHGGYTYSWAAVSGDTSHWTANSPTAAATSFHWSAVSGGVGSTDSDAVFRCTVTDDLGAVVASADVAVHGEYIQTP